MPNAADISLHFGQKFCSVPYKGGRRMPAAAGALFVLASAIDS